MSNAAIIKTSSGKSVEVKGAAGLFECVMEHEVKSTKASYVWSGPKISIEEWAKMMAFFEWTQETEKSEAQVRWFVHPEHGWKCWAFTQKGGTGMTTKDDMTTPESIEQRAQFSQEAGWLYYMTVHHHCTSGAFQSSTDETDEKGVDGLHITIGKMNDPKRDIHCRLYQKGSRFEPQMQHFWDVGEQLMAKALEFSELFGGTVDLDKAARLQMAQSSQILRGYLAEPVAEPFFPEQWKVNYVVTRYTPPTHHYQGGLVMGSNNTKYCRLCDGWMQHDTEHCPFFMANDQHLSKRQRKKLERQARKGGQTDTKELSAVRSLLAEMETNAFVMGMQLDDFYTLLGQLADGPEAQVTQMIYDTLHEQKEKLTVEDLATSALEAELELEKREQETATLPPQQQPSRQELTEMERTAWEGCGG